MRGSLLLVMAVMVEDTNGLVSFGARAVLLGIAATAGAVALIRWRRASVGLQVWLGQ